jgi:hypothetical protein
LSRIPIEQATQGFGYTPEYGCHPDQSVGYSLEVLSKSIFHAREISNAQGSIGLLCPRGRRGAVSTPISNDIG